MSENLIRALAYRALFGVLIASAYFAFELSAVSVVISMIEGWTTLLAITPIAAVLAFSAAYLIEIAIGLYAKAE